MSETEIGMVAEYADIVQIGSRNMENTSLLLAAARCGRPILLKRGLTARIEDLLQAAQLVMESGNPDVILCERGIRTFETATRNTLDIQAVPVLHAVTHLPVIVDPSHASGVRELVPLLARVAVAADAEGVIVEVHPDPARAWCDGEQSLTFAMFREMMADLAPYRALRAQKQKSAMAHAAEQR
jgi:3-deoxy-7-phosphoheptulonate synthase